MSAALMVVELNTPNRPFHLFFDVIAGAIIYMLTLCVTWLAAGRPAGIEQAILDYVNRFRKT